MEEIKNAKPTALYNKSVEFVKKYFDKYRIPDEYAWDMVRKNNNGEYIKVGKIIKHDAWQMIADAEEIEFIGYEISNITWSEKCKYYSAVYRAKDKNGKEYFTVGEASNENCKSNFYGCMAEKRGKDRLVAMITKAYAFGVYEETYDDYNIREKWGNNQDEGYAEKLYNCIMNDMKKHEFTLIDVLNGIKIHGFRFTGSIKDLTDAEAKEADKAYGKWLVSQGLQATNDYRYKN